MIRRKTAILAIKLLFNNIDLTTQLRNKCTASFNSPNIDTIRKSMVTLPADVYSPLVATSLLIADLN